MLLARLRFDFRRQTAIYRARAKLTGNGVKNAAYGCRTQCLQVVVSLVIFAGQAKRPFETE